MVTYKVFPLTPGRYRTSAKGRQVLYQAAIVKAMSVPYIGAKISLTSRSLIRYEGTLASVDAKEATISLENVRLMGTEGRRPGQEIPSSNDIYDAVVFRSADIEDLQIFEAPVQVSPPPPITKPFMDPAIVTTKSSTSSTNNGNLERSAGGWPAAPRLQFGTATSTSIENQRPTTVSAFGSLPTNKTGSGSGVVGGGGASTWAFSVESGNNNNNNNNSNNQLFGSNTQVNSKPTFGSIASRTLSEAPRTTNFITPSNLSKASNIAPPSLVTKEESDIKEKVMAYNTGTGRMEMVERQSRSYAAVVSDGAGRFKLAGDTSARLVPRGEYDFAQANARLNKETLPELSITERATFYDRTSSFFDNISCEATAGGKDAKLPDKNERRWNIETFGVAAPAGHYHQHRRGGGGSSHGYGYRGGNSYHRGGYNNAGYGNNNNNRGGNNNAGTNNNNNYHHGHGQQDRRHGGTAQMEYYAGGSR